MGRIQDLATVAGETMHDQRDIVPRRSFAEAGDIPLAGRIAELRAVVVMDEDRKESRVRRRLCEPQSSAINLDVIPQPGRVIEHFGPGFGLDIRVISKRFRNRCGREFKLLGNEFLID